MANRRDTQFFYTPHNKSTLLDCSFNVLATNASGITLLNASGRIASVFMHTSTTPAAGNPNPGTGVILVNFMDNYNRYLGGFANISAAPGTPTGSLTANAAYVIVTLGTTTTAQWHTAGVPAGITPAVGVSFVAAATAAVGGTGTATLTATAGSGIDHIELIGDPNKTIISSSAGGGYVLLQCFLGGVKTAPANNSVIRLGFYMNNSAQGV